MAVLRSLFVFLFTSAAFAAEMPVRRIVPGDVPDEYLVGLKDVPRDQVDAVAAELAARVGGELVAVWKEAVRGFWIRVPAAQAKLLFADRRVSSVEQNATVHPSSTQNTSSPQCTGTGCERWGDPALWEGLASPALWHLGRISYRARTPERPYMWFNDGRGVTAYVVDGGSLRFHREFADSDNLTDAQKKDPSLHDSVVDEVEGSNRIAARAGQDQTPSSAPYPRCEQPPLFSPLLGDLHYWSDWPWFNPVTPGGSDSDHGMGVASILGGRTVGVAKGIRIVPVKVNGCGASETIADMTSALNWIREQEEHDPRTPAVVSISTYRDNQQQGIIGDSLSLLEQAIDALTAYGIPVISAAGNLNDDACLYTPARMSRRGGRGQVITVGGLAKGSDTRWFTPDDEGSNNGACVDLVAPAEAMPVAYSIGWNRYRHAPNVDDNESNPAVRFAGTSYSAPLVAGLAARMIAEDTELVKTLTKLNSTANAKFTKTIGDRLIESATVLNDRDSSGNERHSLGVNSPARIAYMGSISFTSQPQSKDLPSTNRQEELTAVVPKSVPVCAAEWFQSTTPDYTTGVIVQPRTAVTADPNTATTLSYPATLAGQRAYYWVRAYSRCEGEQEYSDSAMGALSVGCSVILEQPASVWAGYKSQTAPVLRVEVQSQSDVTVTWYEGRRGDLAHSTHQQTVPGIAGQRVFTFTPPLPGNDDPAAEKAYWARITNNSSGCRIDSDIAQVRTCPVPVVTGVTASALEKNGHLTVAAADSRNATTYCLMVLTGDDPAEESSWLPYSCGTSASFIAPGGLATRFKIRAINDCRSVDSTNDVIYTPANCPASYEPSELDRTRASATEVSAGQFVTLSQPYLQETYVWRSSLSGTSTPGPDIPNTNVNQVTVRPWQATVYWSELTICGTPRRSLHVIVMTRPRFDAHPPAEVVVKPGDLAPLSATATPIPDGTGVTMKYEWFHGEDPATAKSVAKTQTYQASPGVYFVRATANYPLFFDPTYTSSRTVSTDSRIVRVVCGTPPKPVYRRRRPSRSGGTTVSALSGGVTANSTVILDTITAGQAVRIDLDAAAGVSYEWYKGNDYSDLSQRVGSGTSLTVAPTETTTYWVRAVASCGTESSTNNSDFFVIQVACGLTITKQPEAAVSASGTVTTSVEAIAGGKTLTYLWHSRDPEDPNDTFKDDGTSATYTFSAAAPAYREVYVDVTAGDTQTCTLRSHTVPLAIVPSVQQRIFGYTPGATLYSSSLPQKLIVTMDPQEGPDHVYAYSWYRDDGTPGGQQLTDNTLDREINVTTSSIDTFWVIVRGTHTYNGIQYYEYTTSKRMYVDLYGTCVLPPLKVTQSHVTIDLNTSPDVVLNAFCDWYDVEFEWYGGQTGDTRHPVNSDLGKPDQLTVATGSIDPYWVRAKRGCGAFVDSPTITFRRGECGPTMINQDVASVEVPYGETAYLHVDPLAVDRPSYRWYQNEGQETPVDDDDQIPTTLKLPNVQKSGRYWVLVRNLDCSNADESYMATVRVASHPNLTPPAWHTEVWTDSGTRATLNATSANATHYQWFAGEVGDERPGRRIDNEMFATYQTPPLTSEAKYWARVYAGTAGNLDSPTMTVRICERARIVNTSPTQRNLLPGQATYLDVTAAGTGLTYQWYKGGTPGVVAGATPIGFAIDRLLIQPTQTTTYWLLVTGHCGSGGTDTSAVWATFTASVCPLVENPTSAKPTVMPGATTMLSITATGYALQYQWYIGTPGSGTAIDGATSATVPTPPINAPTTFWCKVTSGSCSRNSEAVVVGLCGEPTVRWMTGNKNVSKGEVVDFIIDADHSTETPMVTVYAGPAGNVTASTVLVPAQPVYHFTQTFTATTALWARAVVDNCHADTANITVTVCIPKITTQPAAASITAGNSTTLTVGTDIPPASYQWYIGETGDISTPVSNGTGPSLTVSPTVSMKYWVRVKGCGSSEADSIAALVSVCTPAAIASHSQSQWLTKGATRELTVDGHGTDLTYRWYRGTAGNTANQIGNSFSVFVTPTDTTSYWARVSNGCGSADTATIVVSVCATPVITAQPASQRIFSGTTATLSVTATQETSTAMSYQWYRGTGTANPVGTSSPTFVTPALTADTTYWVRITAGTCSVDSAPAAITMCAYSQTLNGPDDKDIAVGQTTRLSATISPVPQQVRWYRGVQGDRTNLVSTLSYADVAPTVTTQYWGEFTHDGCAMKSRTVTVFVSIPTITQQPADVQVNNGQTATLTVAADTAGVMYQWFSGTSGSGTAISGATSASFTTLAMTTTTSYWARVTGSRGHVVNSNTAVVSVCLPASISQEPASSSIRRGSSASLSVTAGGTNLRYQWYRATAPSETNPSGTAASISVSPNDPSNYWVKVTSDCGTKNSATATVSVCIDPTINTQPASQTIYSGTTATLSVTATAGTALPLSYQWYSGTSGTGTAISGATSATFTTPALTATANHWVKVTSGVCSINSNTATITMCAYNATLNGPDDRDVAVGGTVRLSVNLSPVPQSGKWFRGAQGDRTNQISSYTFADVSPTATTQYWGELTHDGCTTKTRTVTVYVSVPTITQQPAPATQVNPNTSATLTVAANTAGVTYQWYSGTSGSGTPISGATGTSYVTPALASGSAASYWVKVTGSRGHAVNSDTASVTWCQPASITYHPSSRSIRRGSSVSMTVTASGTNLRYQWYRATSPNEVNGIASATSSQYDIVPLDTVAYWVRVTSDCGVAYSTTAQIDVCLDPTINTHPASQYVNSGSTATLSVSATANTTLGLTYQWYSGTSGSGTSVPGATGATFTTPALTAAANYWVKVTSGACSTNSNTATISICSYPATLNSPSDRNVRAGVATLLSVSLNPTPQTWKWYRGAQGDRTNLISSQPAVNVYPTVTTQYWGELTNNGCTTKTRTVTINVCVPTITAQPQSITISYGTSTTLSVSATEAVTYQWYKGSTGQAISGATSATYTTPVLYNDESYWVRITGSCGVSTDSGDAYVTVN